MRTIVQLDDYRIEYDGSRNWTVTKRMPAEQRKNTKNAEVDKLVGYYGSLQSAVHSIANDSMGDFGEIDGLKRLQEAVAGVHDSIRSGMRKMVIPGVPEKRVREL